jgi:hypothetical protein
VTTSTHSSSSARLQRPEPDPRGHLVLSLVFLQRTRENLAAIPELCVLSAISDTQARIRSTEVARLPGFASPSSFPSRCFSHPQGFTSCVSLQPYFMLLPLIGFAPSEFFPRWKPQPSPARYPPGITRRLICEGAWAGHNQPKLIVTRQTPSSTSRCLCPFQDPIQPWSDHLNETVDQLGTEAPHRP